MATKVKPTRLNISGTIQAGQVPTYIDADCFGVGTIPTDNCQLANGCGYLQSCDLACYAQCCDVPTDNCQLANGCGYITGINCNDVTTALGYTPYDCTNPSGYTTCTGTLVACDIANLAQCCDIPTDNCQLSNGCGYTTCTGTLVPSDIQNLAQCCDIPTDNCQLANGCGYTTCTGTLVPSDLNCYAKCCDIPTDNCQLSNGCNYLKSCDLPDLSGYQLKCNMVCNLTGADNNHYPTAKAVTDAISCLGGGDMLKATYDPCNCNDDAFDYNNFYNTPNMCCYAQICDIPTDNCQLANGCCYADCDYVNNSINSVTAYYITKNAQGDQFATYAELAAATTFYSGGQTRIPTRNDYTIVLADENHDNATTRYIYNSGWEYQYTVNETALTQAQLDAINSGITCAKVSCYDNCMAQCCDIPTNNCQLSNGCGYITGINCNDVTTALGYTPAQCCDIPTDNCQLGNTCGYIKGITCSDVTTALGYTPYSNANPNGYTSCTGTLKACDLCGYAQCCDIPTDNSQLANGCGYTTCTGTLVPSSIKTINGCCLIGSGDVCIQGGVTSVNGQTGAVCLTIPTDNCQLSNGCGYTTCTGTLSSCADVISALGFTPYNCTNPAGYTTCTGTLNGGDLKTVNGCCLVGSGDICIQGGGGIDNLPGSPVCICYKWTGDMCAYCALGTYRCDTEYNVYE